MLVYGLGPLLLRQTDGSESVSAIGMNLDPHDQPIAKGELVRHLDLDGGAASLPGGGPAYEDEHALVVDIEEAVSDEADRLAPRTGVAERSHLLDAMQHRLIRIEGREVELGVPRELL